MNVIYRIMRPSGVLENITIRNLRKTDLPALEWEGEFIHFRNVYADLYMKIEKGTARAWVAVNSANFMIGQVFLQLTSDRLELADGWNRAYLYSFRIRPNYQSNGLGTKILSILEDELVRLKYTRLTLNVANDNLRAIKLYKNCGFQIVADEPGVWSYPDHNDVWQTIVEPAWRMEKKLVSK
jgi:ribosomal protein S18 acetylase RimI-like enzyme